MPGFLGIERISQGPWQALERAIQRLLVHAGFDDVRLVGGTGDGGADVVANLKQQTWVIQSKYRSRNQVVGANVVDEVAIAIGIYGAEVAVVATNASVSKDAIQRAKRLEMDYRYANLAVGRQVSPGAFPEASTVCKSAQRAETISGTGH